MKIGIVTVYEAANFGSYLQAFALFQTLKNMGHDVYFIKNDHPDVPYKRQFYKYPINRRSIKHPLAVFREYREGREKCRLFQKEVKKLPVIEFSKIDELDKIILGSDEIWNVTMRCFTSSFYFGAGMHDLVTYAVSVGKASVEDFEQYPELVDDMIKIDKILVRDENSRKVVTEFTKKNVQIVCDPTFLVPLSCLKTNILDEYIKNNRYILIYSYPGYISDSIKENIIRFACEEGLKIVSACFSMDWCDYMLNCSPLEFCEAIRYAEYVFTTTFHGSIVSLLNHKQFVATPSGIKVSDVLKRVGLSEVIIDKKLDYKEFTYLLKNVHHDYSAVDSKIKEMRRHGLEELKKVINS